MLPCDPAATAHDLVSFGFASLTEFNGVPFGVLGRPTSMPQTGNAIPTRTSSS
jgi:hypothetical protein